ncbi:MAG: AraC family transcriptional regulator [Acidobacteriota bacterium]
MAYETAYPAVDLTHLAARAGALATSEGFNATCLPRVHVHTASAPMDRQPILYDAWLVALLQGEKILYQRERVIRFNQESVLCVAAGTPTECVALASSDAPLISVVLEINTEDLLSMAARIADPADADPTPPHVMDIVPMTPDIQDTLRRLIDLMHNPLDASVLGDGTVTELIYRVLQNGLARSLVALASNRNTAAILRTLRTIQQSYAEALSVDALAKQAGMSVSSFHAHFRKTTAHPPQKYIKRIRLSKARSLIGGGHQTVREAAFAVGYSSASQFSREYKQYYGVKPGAHVPSAYGCSTL